MPACLLHPVSPAQTPLCNSFLRWLSNLWRRESGHFVLIAIAPLVCLAIVAPFGLANTGLLHTVGVPPWLVLLVLFHALELMGHCFHHAVHAVQHSDTGRNCTTARRQHTLEVVIGAVVALAVLLALVLRPDV